MNNHLLPLASKDFSRHYSCMYRDGSLGNIPRISGALLAFFSAGVFFLLDSGLLGINLGFSGELWVAGYVYTAFSLVLLILWELEVFDHPLQIILGLALAAGLGYLWGAWPRASGVFLPFLPSSPCLWAAAGPNVGV
jgi:hypothetical protein